MGVLNLLRLPVTLVHRTGSGIDEYGEPIEFSDESGDDNTTVTVGHIAQIATREEDGGVVTMERLQLLIPPDVPIEAWDYAIVNGRHYEVDGQPFESFNPRTNTVSHLIVYLKRGA